MILENGTKEAQTIVILHNRVLTYFDVVIKGFTEGTNT